VSEYTIYGFFNAQEIAGVLNAVVMLMGSTGVGGDYLSLIRVAAMLGLFVAISAAFLRHRGEDAVKYLIFMALFYSTMFVPRVNVVIEDRAAASGAPIPVNNVPLGLAFFASSTSHIGAWLAEQTETFFSLPDSSMRLAQSGVLGGARALRELGKAGINDPILAYDVSVFMQECINPELVSAPALLPMMFEARDIVNFIDTGSIVNPGRMAVLSGSGATDCSSAWTTLKAAINAESTNQLSQIARQFSPHLTQAQANTLFASLLPAQEAMIMTASSSAQASVRQRMMINALNESAGSMAVILNDPSASKDALGTAIAASSANSSYRSPEPETLIRAPNFAEGSADVTHTAAVVAWAEPDDFPVQSQNAIEEQMLNVSCPTRMHMWGNAYNPDTGIYGVQAIPDQFHDDKWLF
jgi:conjugal transfer mating pair stabilization protein TraG